MPRLLPALLAALAALAVPPAVADSLVRCTAPGGQVTWSNVGCAASERAEPLKVAPRPNVVDSSGLRDWARRSPARRESAVEARTRERAAATARPVKVRDAIACENAQRDYRFEAGYRGPRRGGMGALRDEVKRACGS